MKLSQEELKLKFGKPLREFMIYKGWGLQKKFAHMLDISPSMLSQLLSGRKFPSLELARKLEKLGFDITIIDQLNEIDKFLPDISSYEEMKFQYLELKERYNDLKKHSHWQDQRIDELVKQLKRQG